MDEPVSAFWVNQFMEFVNKNELHVEDFSGTEEEVKKWIKDAKAEHTAFLNAVIDHLASRDDKRSEGQLAMRKAIQEFLFRSSDQD